MAISLGDAVLKLGADTSAFSQGLTGAASNLTRFVDNNKRGLMTLGAGFAAAGAAVVGFGLMSLNTFKDFEKEMAMVQAVTQATEEEFAALEAKAQELGASTVYTAREIAEAMKWMGMAGLDATEILEGMTSVTNLALAGQMELGEAADIVTNIMGAYSMEASDLSHATDVMVASFTGANTTLQQIGDAFTYVGPVAYAAGMSFEGTGAALMELADAGIRGSMAGTTLRGAITRLLNPSEEAAKVIERLGLDIYDYGEATEAAEEYLAPLRQAVDRATVEFDEQDQELQRLKASYQETTAEMQEMDDALDDLSDSQAENRLAISEIRYAAAQEGRELTDQELAQITEIELANQGLQLEYDRLRIAQDNMSEAAETEAEALAAAQEQHDLAAQSLSEQQEALATATEAWDESSKGLKGWEEIVRGLEESGASAGDMMLIFGQRAGPGMQLLVDQGADSLAGLTEELEGADGAAQDVADTMGDTLWSETKEAESAMEAMKIAVGEGLAPAMTGLLDAITPVFQKLADFAEDHPKIVEAIGAVGVAFVGAGAGLLTFAQLPAAVSGAKTAFSGLSTAASALASPVGLVAIAVAALVAEFVLLYQYWEEIPDWAQTLLLISTPISQIVVVVKAVKENWDKLVSAFNKFKAGDIAGGFKEMGRFAKGFYESLRELVPPIRWIETGVTWVRDKVKERFEELISFVHDVCDRIAAPFRQMWDFLEPGFLVLGDIISNMFNKVRQDVETVFNAISSVAQTAWGIVTNIVQTQVDLIVGIVRVGWGVLEEIFELISIPFQIAWNLMALAVETFVGTIRGIIEPLSRWFEDRWNQFAETNQRIWDAITGVFEGIWDRVSGFVQSCIDGIVGVWETLTEPITIVWDGIVGIVEGIWDRISEPVHTAIDGIKGVWDEITDKVTDIWDGVVDGIKGLWGRVSEPIGTFVTNIKDKVGEIGKKFTDIFTTLPTIVKNAFNNLINLAKDFSWSYSGWSIAGKEIIPSFDFTPFKNLPKLAKGGVIPEPTLLYGMKSMRPYAIAGEAGTEYVTPKGQGNINNNFNISQLVVREQADVNRVARELYRLQQTKARQHGT